MSVARAAHFCYRGLSWAHRCTGGGWVPRAGSRVLLFHSLGAEIPGDPYGLSCPPAIFAAHMDRLASLRETWRPVPFGRPSAEALEVSVVFDDGFRDTLTVAAPLLSERGIPFTVFVTAGFVKGGSPLHLSPADLKRLAQLPGAQIGSHGFTHARLDRSTDSALARELIDSRKYLEDAIGRPVDSISYPHGAADRRVAFAARQAGYRAGGTSRYGLNVAGRDPLLLCRTEITAFDSVEDFELKLRGCWDWFRFRHPDPARL